MMDRPITVAVTSVGSGVGQSVVDSCRRSSLDLRLIGLDLSPFCFGGYSCDLLLHLPSAGSPGHLDRLLDVCEKERVDILIPGLDSELLAISENAHLFEARGTKVLVARRDFVNLCRDKVKWSSVLSRISPTILPCFTQEELPKALAEGSLRFPFIAKPLDGSASAGVLVINSRDELVKVGPGHVVQPLVLPAASDPHCEAVLATSRAGKILQNAEISMQSVYGRDGALLGRMTSYHRLKDGIPLEIVPVEIEEANEAMSTLEPYLKSIGMTGPVNLQGRITEEGPRFFEMNARFTGITGARALLGFNEVEALIRDALGLPSLPGALVANPRRVAIRQVNDRAVEVHRQPALREAAMRRGHRPGAGQHVLVTGASGWLGRHLVGALAKDSRVSALTLVTRDGARLRSMLPASSRPIRVCEIPPDGGLPLFPPGQIDLVYHLASGRQVDSLESQADSLRFGQKLLQHLARNSLGSFVNISSQSVYGTKKDPPWRETDLVAPETPYAMSKWAGESLADSLRDTVPLNRSTSIRLARLYGAAEGLRWSELPHLFAEKAAAGQPLTVKGGKQAYDLIHIRDAVTGLLAFLDDGRQWQSLYNLGSGGSVGITSIAEAAIEAAAALCQSKSVLTILPGEDAMRTGMSIQRFEEDFTWKPAVSMTDAMLELVQLARAKG